MQQLVVCIQHLRRSPGKRFDEKYTISTTKLPSSQMTWSTMCNSGIAGLYFLTSGTTSNGEEHMELLKENLAIHMHIHNSQFISIHNIHI